MTEDDEDRDDELSDEAEEALAEAYNRGLELEKSGDVAAAAAAYREALALDASDPGGVSVRLAALGQAPTPNAAPAAYVEMLFDQHAESFESILVDQLDYHVPTLVHDRLVALGLTPFDRMLDLGCGTGLGADALNTVVREAIGIDISEAMVDIAEQKDVYDGLYVGEVVDFLEDNDEAPFDLVLAADVLPYLGAVERFFAGVARMLGENDVFAFSTEKLGSSSSSFVVGVNRRFLHSEAYLRDSLAKAGFEIASVDEINVRNEDGAPSPGQLFIARKL